MKLLSKENIKNKKRADMAKEVLLAQKVLAVTENARKKLNVTKQQVEAEQDKLDRDFMVFVDKIEQKRIVLLNEVQTLEGRKQEALEPITEIKLEAEESLAKSKEAAELVSKDRNDLSFEEVEHQKKVTTLKKDEDKSLLYSNELTERENSVIIKETQLRTDENDLTSYITEQHGRISKRVEELDNKEAALKQQRVDLDTGRKLLAIANDEIDKRQRQLEDQRQTLERAFERIKK